MKLVTAVRHAKSDWNTGLPDIERPLNGRGKKNAPDMGRRMVARGIVPELLISSPAKRAVTTANLFAEAMGLDGQPVELADELYGAGPSMILDVLSELPESVGHVMFFCHNPGITEFVNRVAHAGIANIPTCGVAHLEFVAEGWPGVHGMEARLEHFDFPKNSS